MMSSKHNMLISKSSDKLPPASDPNPGWPWHHKNRPNELPIDVWPKISIVTPSYNQAEYLEQTIRSVLLQRYPNLEYIIMDGGSTDGSVEIIRKYQEWITFWTSEEDQGQTDAIQKGFSRSTGSILAWLNSDDIYFPGALVAMAQAHLLSPRTVLLGKVQNFSGIKNKIIHREICQEGITLENLLIPGIC